MGESKPSAINDHREKYNRIRQDESEWLLQAIANAIAAVRLPPDDAFAWARIAACEVAELGARPMTAAGTPVQGAPVAV